MRKTFIVQLASSLPEKNYHQFEKTNLMTISSRFGSYDEYQCKCGLKARSYQLGILKIKNSDENKFKNDCPKYVHDLNDESYDVGKEIKIIRVSMASSQIKDLTPNSVHKIVLPPEEYKQKYPNSQFTVWVMGQTEPVRLLQNEFNFLDK